MKQLKVLFCYILWTQIGFTQNVPKPLPPLGHSLFVMDFDIHPNSQTYTTAGIDRKLIAWDIKTGIPFQSIQAHNAEIYSVRYDWMGDTLITASPDSTVKIWNSDDLSLLHTIYTGTQNTYAEFSRHNNQILATGSDGYVKIYDKKTYDLLHKIKAHEGKVNCAAFTTNGALVFTGGEDGWVYAYDIKTGKQMFTLDMKAPIKNITFDMFNTAMIIHAMNGRAEILLVPSFKGYGAVPVPTQQYFGNIAFVSQIDISPDNHYFAYADSTYTVYIADAKTKEARGYQTPHTDFIAKVKYSFDMKYLLSLDHDQKMVIAALHNFDFDQSKQVPVRIAKHYSDQLKSLYLGDHKKVYIRGFYSYVWDLVNGDQEALPITLNYENHLKQTLSKIEWDQMTLWLDAERDVVLVQEKKEHHFRDPLNYAFNKFRTRLWVHDDQQFYLYDVPNEKLIAQGKFELDTDFETLLLNDDYLLAGKEGGIFCFHFDGKKYRPVWQKLIDGVVDFDSKDKEIAVGTTGKSMFFVDLETGDTKQKWEGTLGQYQRPHYHSTENWLAVNSFEGDVVMYDRELKKKRYAVKIENNDIRDIAFSKDGNVMGVIGNDFVVRLYNIKPKKEEKLFDIYTLKEQGMVAMNKEGYYQSTKNAHQNLAYQFKGKIYSCQQFDAIYNRPDLVLQESPYADDWYVDMFTQAVEKRVQKMNAFPQLNRGTTFPEASIQNKTEYPNIIENNTVAVNLTGSDSTQGLAIANLYINNVPYFGKSGKKIEGIHYQESLSIELPDGPNTIRWSVKNKNGIESLYDELKVTVLEADAPDLYIATVGVSAYEDTRFNLTYAAKDAEDVLNSFKKSNAFKKIYQKKLTDKEVTLQSVRDLRQFFEKAGPNDVVILFVAGHGVLDENLSYYFATHDMDFNNPSKKGLEYAMLESLLDDLKAIKKVLLMDTCHSGEIDKDEMAYEAETTSFEGTVTFRSAGAGVREKEGVGTVKVSELAKALFADMRKGTGTTVISSAGGVEFAMESKSWKNGLFTYCLLQGLKSGNADLDTDGKVTVSELQWYIKDRVTKLSNGKQTPTYRTENIEMDFEVY